MTHETKNPEEELATSKREYSTPKLTDYGSLSRLTMGGTELGNDGNTKCTGGNAAAVQCEGS